MSIEDILVNNIKDNYSNKKISFAYSPENLRLGNAIDVYLNPDRIVVGVRNEKTKIILDFFIFQQKKSMVI